MSPFGSYRSPSPNKGLRNRDDVPTKIVMTAAARHAGSTPSTPVPTTASDVAVVRLPIADAKGAVVGHELVFADATVGFSPAFNARATAGMLAGAYADIDLDRLTGSHLAWLSVARNFLVEVGMPPVRPDRAVIQVAAYPAKDDLMEVLDRLTSVGFTLALTGYDGTEQLDELLQLCSIVKAPLGGMDPGRRVELVDELNAVGAQIVATGVDDEAAMKACAALGVHLMQGDVLSQPRPVTGRNVATSSAGSLRSLAELGNGDLSFEAVEQVVTGDIGLSLKLLRYVNSAFFALPRTISSVREALTLLGSRTVHRWAMVVVMADAPEAPDELVALALQRGRMCETLAHAIAPEEEATLFTVGMFSVADSLLGMRMEDILAELPFSPEVQAALLRHEGPKGRLLQAVLAYERGEFPELPGIARSGASVAGAYRDAVAWADEATRSVRHG